MSASLLYNKRVTVTPEWKVKGRCTLLCYVQREYMRNAVLMKADKTRETVRA